MTVFSASALWQRVRRSFEHDDGSLPTVEFGGLTPQEVAEIYRMAREGTCVASRMPVFWDLVNEQERRIDDVSNAAELVAAAKAAPFHFAIDGIGRPDCPIPSIGVQVFQDMIAFDYRMGSQWGPAEVLVFFSWLRDLLSCTRAADVRLGDESPPASEEFLSTLVEFIGLDSRGGVPPGNSN